MADVTTDTGTTESNEPVNNEPNAEDRAGDLVKGVGEEIKQLFGGEWEDDESDEVEEDEDEKPSKGGKSEDAEEKGRQLKGGRQKDEEPEEGEDKEKDEEAAKASKRENKRIRELIAERKALKAEADRAKAEAEQAQQMRQYLYEAQQRQQEFERQNAVMQKELEMMRQMREKESEKDLDPVERYRRQVIAEAHAKAREELQPEIERVKQQYDETLRYLQDKEAKAARDQRTHSIISEAHQAVDEMLADFPVETKRKLGRLPSHALNMAYTSNMSVADAAKQFRKDAYLYVLTDMKLRSRKNGTKAAKAESVPKSISSNKANTKSSKPAIPSQAEIRKGGFRNAIEWLAAKAKE